MYIAVVMTAGEIVSKRDRGDWAAFVAPKRDDAIRWAIDARRKWGGDYAIYVGKLTHEVGERTEYDLVRMI